MTIRILIIENSTVVQRRLAARLSPHDDLDIVDYARDAREGRAMIKALDPDVVVMDTKLPGLDGLSFLEKIMALRPTPVVMIADMATPGDPAAARARQLGAVGCCARDPAPLVAFSGEGDPLVSLVRKAARTGPAGLVAPARAMPVRERPRGLPELIAIGSSTGGVEALRELLVDFPHACPPTVIVQHVKARFAGDIVDALNAIVPPRVVLAQTDTVLKPGHVYLAPGNDRHLRISSTSHGIISLLRPGPPVSGHRPSVDVMFASVAQNMGASAIGVLLTGMGQDGANGLCQMAQAGAWTVAQDEESCVVFGMPKAAIERGGACAVKPLTQIAEHIFTSEGACL
ncbi:chemotaxis-specific protein-glutamate methyltransferase CheB [Croceicoccus hydrothermalis]|uniref:chemotaxis-specific protein-glutamate methyltransferase CheB n=1 Tax=Croceicoccus hydrothermalis TaxID=2867964 RepID=UPI001EFB0825|nr:chemotaxis-specific protein-glutamate methyltransferase CheB [Croceicoccus hydrothermalis]